MAAEIPDITPMAKIAPSILGADFSRLGEEVRSADAAGVDMFHLDIMDGHFVPNISFGPDIVKTVNDLTKTFLDVHLMLSQPEKYFDDFIRAGADSLTFHIEVHPQPVANASLLKSKGVKTGISLNPDTPIEQVLPFLEHFDFLLVMSVFPGFGGQQFIEETLPKIAAARRYLDEHRLATQLQVDGGINEGNARKVVEAGADILVMGTAFFGAKDREALVTQIRNLKPVFPR